MNNSTTTRSLEQQTLIMPKTRTNLTTLYTLKLAKLSKKTTALPSRKAPTEAHVHTKITFHRAPPGHCGHRRSSCRNLCGVISRGVFCAPLHRIIGWYYMAGCTWVAH